MPVFLNSAEPGFEGALRALLVAKREAATDVDAVVGVSRSNRWSIHPLIGGLVDQQHRSPDRLEKARAHRRLDHRLAEQPRRDLSRLP